MGDTKEIRSGVTVSLSVTGVAHDQLAGGSQVVFLYHCHVMIHLCNLLTYLGVQMTCPGVPG